MIKLTALSAADNRISDIGAIRNCALLAELQLSNNEISDLSALGNDFEELTLLDITNNNVYGCTMVMNEALRAVCCGGQLPDELVLKRKNHDAWTLYVAYCVGVFVFDLESKMLYRQHEAQVVGVKKVSRLKKPFVKAKRLFAKKNKGLRSQVAKDLLRNYSEQMNSEVRRHLEVLANAKSFSGVRALMKDDVLMQGFTESRIKVFIRGLLKWI